LRIRRSKRGFLQKCFQVRCKRSCTHAACVFTHSAPKNDSFWGRSQPSVPRPLNFGARPLNFGARPPIFGARPPIFGASQLTFAPARRMTIYDQTRISNSAVTSQLPPLAAMVLLVVPLRASRRRLHLGQLILLLLSSPAARPTSTSFTATASPRPSMKRTVTHDAVAGRVRGACPFHACTWESFWLRRDTNCTPCNRRVTGEGCMDEGTCLRWYNIESAPCKVGSRPQSG
jgi:hypothetical protein